MLLSTFIASRVLAINKERKTRLRYCNESGSRAWGLASTDSDYDVRFVYQHPREHYLQLEVGRDTIGPLMELDGELDMAGWDLRKLLLHVAKSNPNVLEWLYSPVTYYVEADFLAELRELAGHYFRPGAAVAHYLGTARSARLKGFSVEDGSWNVKKFCYHMRPILAADYILRERRQPPVAFSGLLGLIDDAHVRNAVLQLIERKATAPESYREVIDERVAGYFEGMAESGSIAGASLGKTAVDRAPINDFFRSTIGY